MLEMVSKPAGCRCSAGKDTERFLLHMAFLACTWVVERAACIKGVADRWG